MSLEFVTVVYVEDRPVFIDGDPSGRTGQTLRVQSGRHTFNMGDPRDCEPKWRRPDVQGTTAIRPDEGDLCEEIAGWRSASPSALRRGAPT